MVPVQIIALFISVAPHQSPADQAPMPMVRVERQKPCMGTTLRLTAFGRDEKSVAEVMEKAFTRAEELNRILSDYLADSELMRLCARAGSGQPVVVSRELHEVLAASRKMSEATDGAFDVTVGPLTREWRLARKSFRLPDPETLARGREVVGYQKMDILEGRKVLLRQKGMRLDLGGIAKGFTADQLLALLRENGLESAMVALGGDLVIGAPPPGKEGWRVELIDLPGDKGGKRIMVLANQAVSTSGDLEQFLEVEGIRYSHLLDPRTGLGTTDRAAATVVARSGMDADSLTKACCLLPEEKALFVINLYKAQARLVRPAPGEGRSAKVTLSPQFPKFGDLFDTNPAK